MIKKIRGRFIFFNIVVISVVFSVMGLIAWLSRSGFKGEEGHLSAAARLTFIIVIFLIFALIASTILARFALEPIKKAWKKQLDFTADASHELRTPLAVIQTNLEIILDNEEERIKSQREWLDNIVLEQQRMAQLVEDLLTLARGDTAEQVLNKETINMSELIEEVQHAFSPIGAKKKITIENKKQGNFVIQGDRKRIKQLIVILVDNAIKYMGRPGNITIEVSASHRRLKRTLRLIISDTGKGIPEDKLPHIFERFYRADPSRTEEGSGLGLSIAKWITETHQGTIQVKSKVDEGTTFIINLPFESEI